MGSFHYEDHRIEYDEYGEGERLVVLVHGLLMNRRMFAPLAPALAERGNRVVCVDLLGHGRSDRPEDLRLYSMPLFARQVAALLDHLGQEQAVVGGTSLGANVGLELATSRPERVRGLFVEMPVLDNALTGVAGFFTPIMLGLRFGRPAYELAARVTSAIPRTRSGAMAATSSETLAPSEVPPITACAAPRWSSSATTCSPNAVME